MKAYGTKRILPVYGDSRPIERRINNVKIAGWKEQSFNATSVSQNDTYNDSAFLKIYGKSEQIQTIQGKNLFDAYNYTTNYPDDIKVINQDGEDWIKMQSSNKQIRYNLKAKENTQHTFTFEFKRYDDTGAYSVVFVLYYTDGTNETIDFGYFGDSILHKVSKTSAENKTISYIRSSNYGNTVYFLLRVANSQLEEGITATTYEPFVPNSPSPDYSSQINSVNDFDLISSGKNLFDLSSITPTQTMAKTDTGLNLTGYQCVGNYMWGKYLKPNTSYRISYYYTGRITNAGGGFRIHSSSKNENIQIAKATVSGSWVTAVFTTPSDISLYDKIWVYGEGEINYIQIEKDIGSRTDYEGHKSNIINFPYTLRSLPDGTKDYIEIDNVNKTAKLYRNVGEKIFNGTESSQLGGGGTNVITQRFYLSLPQVKSNGRVLCNKFEEKNPGSINFFGNDSEGCNISNGYYLQARINKTRLTDQGLTVDVNGFKSWLATQYSTGTPVTIYYQLATPTIENLEYEEVKTYYPYTNIYTTATVQPTLDGKIRIIDRGVEMETKQNA